LQAVTISAESLEIGALVTLAELEAHPDIIDRYPALAQAAASVATPQIRNVGTLGGNLCQRPRCWYFRSPLFDCRKKGGTICFAVNGNSKYHAILGGKDCFIVHPSDTAVPLISYGAEVTVAGPDGARRLPLEELFVGPDVDILRETALGPGEILTGVALPRPPEGQRSIFLKTRERQAQDFALVSVAVALRMEGDRVIDACVTLGGVAPVPLRLPSVEKAIQGVMVRDVDVRALGEMAVDGARPLRDNHFKVPLTSTLVRRAIGALLGQAV